MKTAVMSIKIDPKVKREVQKVANELGFSVSSLINAYLVEMIRTKTVVFSLRKPSPIAKEAIRLAEEEMRGGKLSGPFETADEFISHLRSR